MGKPPFYRIIIVGCVASIVLGILLFIEFQNDYIYPLNRARVALLEIQATSDPQKVETQIEKIKTLLPMSGNPVWISITEDTNFGLMQNDLTVMLATTDKIATTSPDSAAFNAGMRNVHAQATTILFNLLDATRWTYVNIEFILADILWINGAFGLAVFSIKRR
ncbi:MAG: hypothetical protein KGI27_11920 [Thaumarchaeota archaeon]|nr:hypothetical protein [Nitrososphaerota archaeon]